MDPLQRSIRIVSLFVTAVFSVLFGRLFYLQVLNFQEIGSISTSNSIRRIWSQPPRGRMIDKNGLIVVDNQALYTVKIIPSEFRKAKTDYLAWLLQIDKNELAEKISKGSELNRFTAITVSRNLNSISIARLSENLWQLPGVIIDTDNKRKYPDSFHGAHIFGYTRPVSKEQIEELNEDNNASYAPDDKIGFSGLEKYYEEYLRGDKGARYEMITPVGKFAGKYNNGKNDIPSVRGDDLYLALDGGLQQLAEQLLTKTGKSGAVVAIDPSTGGILALASAPDYDLDTFNGSTDRKGWNDIITSPQKPLFNRTIQAVYPPGSIYKMILAMAALEEKKIDPQKKILDNGVFMFGNRRFLSNEGKGHGWVDMRNAITVSSNVYFYNLIFNVGFENWTKYGSMFGFGEKTGIDLPGERAGLLPSTKYYDKRYGKDKWTKGYLVQRGTGTLAKVSGITIAGKTGTAQNPHGKDHAWFIAFAPVENPKIAMAVLVENAGFGGSISAPIARELIKYYLQGRVMPGSSPQRGIKASNTPLPTPESSDNDLPEIEPDKPLNTQEPSSGATPENNSGKQQQNDL